MKLEAFITKVDSLGNEMRWNFVRASFLYQRALECSKCDFNIALMLLCSCADTLKLTGRERDSKGNFKKLYIDHCPKPLREAPIEYYSQGKLQIAPFEKALDLIYEKFRCPYIHEGMELLTSPNKQKERFVHMRMERDNKDKKVVYHIHNKETLEWLFRVTLESLDEMLVDL